MRISTTNVGKGRRIVRANQSTYPLSYSYESQDQQPTISVQLQGADGKRYKIHLTQGDIDAINAARARYSEHFER